MVAFVEYGGAYKDMADTFKDLVLALVIAVILVYMVMAAQFESFSALVVMFTIPLAFIELLEASIMGLLSVPRWV